MSVEYRPVSGSAYSALMWAARITLAQVSISTLMRMANSSGVLATGCSRARSAQPAIFTRKSTASAATWGTISSNVRWTCSQIAFPGAGLRGSGYVPTGVIEAPSESTLLRNLTRINASGDARPRPAVIVRWCTQATRPDALHQVTPAMALGIAKHGWSICDLLDGALAVAPPEPTETVPDRRRWFGVIQSGR
jgi:hypothetical protein